MIDSIFQQQINQSLDAQQARPSRSYAAVPGTFTGFWGASAGGVAAGLLDATVSTSDIAAGNAQITEGLGLRTPNNSGVLTADDLDAATAQANATRARRIDWSTPWSGTVRERAKAFMPDPQTTGAAAQVTAGVTHFMAQAVPAMAAGGPMGPVIVGGLAGTQEADKLKDAGVDEQTRTQAGAVAGLAAGGSMLLPMTGPTALVRFGKGAAGGVITTAGQAEAERLILQQDPAYERLAATYDPLDPVALTLGALLPGALGAKFGHAKAAPKPMSDAEAANAAAAEARLDPGRIPVLQAEIDNPATTEASRAALQAEMDQIRAHNVPTQDQVDGARVQQTARALDSSRLTPDDDIPGLDQHRLAVERASDQIARGEPVDVSDAFAMRPLPEVVGEPRAPQAVEVANGDAQHMAENAIRARRDQFSELPAAVADAQSALGRPIDPIRFDESGPPEQPPADAHDAHIASLSDLLETTNPDMLVHLDGMEQPLRVADLMEQHRAEALDAKRGALLIDVAARCAIG